MTTTQTDFSPSSYRSDSKPVWCAGCGDFGVLKSFSDAFSNLKLDKNNTAMISGIGCSSRIPGYFSTYGFNTIHGRALPIASGLKAARPDLNVIAVGGDGDGFSIGGGHILHAIRRHFDMTYFVIDNSIYGLTKGQASPTTPYEEKKNQGLAGIEDTPINPINIVFSYGAPFIARVNSTNMPMMTKVLEEAIKYPGFSFIQCLTACVTYVDSDFKTEMQTKAWNLADKNHDPSDYNAAAKVALHEPYAMGIIYKK